MSRPGILSVIPGLSEVVLTGLGWKIDPTNETHYFDPNELSEDSEDDSSSPALCRASIPPPAASLATQEPPNVTTRKKHIQPNQLVRIASPVLIPPLKPKSKVERAPVPGKTGWIKEQVQRQTGATTGQWDIYFYPPGQQVKLRSRPEVKEYYENELNEPYVASKYDWIPSQKPVETVVQEPSTEQTVTEPQSATGENESNDTSEDSYETYAVRVYLAKISEPNTYEEAMASPQKDEWVAAIDGRHCCWTEGHAKDVLDPTGSIFIEAGLVLRTYFRIDSAVFAAY
uniref:MBD domain-containing protein n=1 Tax=Strigamia maritima TaxID=126957 RepID=T1IRT8_STRMM